MPFGKEIPHNSKLKVDKPKLFEEMKELQKSYVNLFNLYGLIFTKLMEKYILGK